MERTRKFIIVKDWNGRNIKIRIGYPFFHADLIEKQDQKDHIDCCGGGYWDINQEEKTITLYGSSTDFGKPKKTDVEQAIKNLTKHDLWQTAWIIERALDIELNETELSTYKFIINY